MQVNFLTFWPMHHSNPPPSKDTTSVTSWSTWILNLKYSPKNISLFKLLGTIIWNSQSIQLPKIPISCTPCQNATLLFAGSTFYPRFEILLLWIYFCSRSLKWLSGNHNAHKLPKSRSLSINFFFSQSKRVQKKKWSREVKNICQQLKSQSTSYSALVNSLSCICTNTSIV